MKRIFDLSEEEVLTLSEEELDRYVDIECAENGVPLLPMLPAEPDYDPQPEADSTVFSVSGVSDYFTDRSVAERLSSTLSGAKRVVLSSVKGAETPRTEGVPSYRSAVGELVEHPCYSEEVYDRSRLVIEGNARKRAVYEADMKEYNDTLRKRREAADSVYDFVGEIRDKDSRRRFLANELERYKELTEGDEKIAIRFLVRAYDDAADFGYISEESTEGGDEE